MAYILVMEFEWDDAKSNDCFMHRGFDFAYAIRAFLDPNRIVGRDRRWDYGEDRYRLLGAIERRVFVLIYTMQVPPSASFRPARPAGKRSENMSETHVRIDPDDPQSLPEGRIDHTVLDGTTETDLALQQQQDDAEAMRDMARYARRVRKRLGLTQVEFARRIDVPHETIRNWEQGKRCPTGAARTLLRVLDKAPETALRVLT